MITIKRLFLTGLFITTFYIPWLMAILGIVIYIIGLKSFSHNLFAKWESFFNKAIGFGSLGICIVYVCFAKDYWQVLIVLAIILMFVGFSYQIKSFVVKQKA